MYLIATLNFSVTRIVLKSESVLLKLFIFIFVFSGKSFSSPLIIFCAVVFPIPLGGILIILIKSTVLASFRDALIKLKQSFISFLSKNFVPSIWYVTPWE